MLQSAGRRFGQRAGEFGRMALGGDQRVDGEGRGGAQDRADIVRIGDLIEHDDEAVGRQFGNIDRLERPRLEQEALMHGVARRAQRDFVRRPEFASRGRARRSPLGEPLGGGGGGVKANELAARRPERRDTL